MGTGGQQDLPVTFAAPLTGKRLCVADHVGVDMQVKLDTADSFNAFYGHSEVDKAFGICRILGEHPRNVPQHFSAQARKAGIATG